MERPVLLVNGIVNNASFHSSPHICQTLHQVIHILHFLCGRLLAKLYPGFCSQFNWIEVRAVQQPKIWKLIGVTTISQQMMHWQFG